MLIPGLKAVPGAVVEIGVIDRDLGAVQPIDRHAGAGGAGIEARGLIFSSRSERDQCPELAAEVGNWLDTTGATGGGGDDVVVVGFKTGIVASSAPAGQKQ